MENDKDNIELRSEKVRKLLGEIPTSLVRWGFVVLALVLVIVLVVLYRFLHVF